MKRFFNITLVWLGLTGLASATPSVFNNYGVITALTNISAVHFNNFGTIEFSVLTSFTNRTGALFTPLSGVPYDTYGTAYFTNTSSGLITGSPGFRFADVTPSTIIPSKSFNNQGVINSIDTPAGITVLVSGTSGSSSGGVIIPNQNQPIPSTMIISSTDVANTGTLSVGDLGAITMTGKNVDLSYGIMTAGSLSATNSESEDESLQAEQYVLVGSAPGKLYTQDAANTFDLLWGATNGLQTSVVDMVIPQPGGLYTVVVPYPAGTTNRNGEILGGSFLNANLTAFTFTYPYPPGQTTNIYYDVVFVNTNFTDPNTSVGVGFGSNLMGFSWAPKQPMQGNAKGIPILVTFSESIVDPISGQTVTNSVYLEDDGDTLNPVELAQNAAYAASYSRPDAFELTTTPPLIITGFGFDGFQIEQGFFLPTNTIFDPGEIYTTGEMAANVYMTNSAYQAQIGRNPEDLDGVFEDLTGLGTSLNDIPDVTNSPGRVTINAENLNLHNFKLRAEGLLTINATNLTGMPTVMDYGVADMNLATRTNSLVVSNLVPVLFDQLRGDIEGWEGTWDNMQTNEVATNDIHTHVLVISDSLDAMYTPTIRNFLLKSTNMVVQDNVRVINNAIFNGKNLTVNSAVRLTANASDLHSSGTPNLRNLLISSNGSFTVDSLFDIGFNTSRPISATSPIGRGYSVLSITNDGIIIATAPTFQARNIENDNLIETINGGSVVLAASTLGLGVADGGKNEILAGGIVTLSANSILVTNSTIDANQILLTPVKELSDFVAGTLGTNSVDGVSDLDNFWTVTNALDLTRKPTIGDLYGTQIHVIAKPGPPTTVTWAGADKGDNLSGWVNNAVVGHLMLDRLTSPAIIDFVAAGHKNALYVNYLELDDASLSDYRDNVFIDPHLKIYFASANVPVNKLTNVSPQFVYAANSLAEAQQSGTPLLRQAALASLRVEGLTGVSAPTVNPPAGVYSGLFAPNTGGTLSDSGYVTFTLEKDGSFSGRALVGSSVVPFSSKLGASGFASVSVGSLSVSFEIDASGNLSGELIGDGWAADLTGSIAGAAPSPFAGRYAINLAGPGGAAPSGASVLHVSVNSQGIVTAAGKLADGASFSESSRVSASGQWPFFAYAPNGKDVLTGWLNFSGSPAQLSGSVNWMKPAKAAKAYPEGFESAVEVLGTAGQ